MTFHELVLPNGLTVIGELNPNVHSVAVGFFVRTGSRDETDEVSGVSHFLEHMVFKGTEKYTAEDVNRIFDEIGAKYNASTSEEVTLFYATILPEYLPQAFELLASILYPSLRDDDFAMEKNVILEEINMYDDMPMFTVYEKSMQTHFAGHPLSRSILGTHESITKLTAEQMRNYHKEHYCTGNITLAVAGNVEWEEVIDLANQYCNHWPSGQLDRDIREAKPAGSTTVLSKPNSLQEHIAQMSPGPSSQDQMRYAAEVLSVIVGDDSNSRLYWDLIETGKADAAELGYNDYDGSGTFMTFLTCQPEQVSENLNRISEIYAEVNEQGVTEDELECAKNKISSRIVLRSERPMGRLSSLGGNWVYRQEYRTVEDDLKVLNDLTLMDLRRCLDAYPLGQMTTAAIGPLEQIG